MSRPGMRNFGLSRLPEKFHVPVADMQSFACFLMNVI
jgi:hypothetical protein